MDEALRDLMLLTGLSDPGDVPAVRPDHDRERRTGVPEVVYAAGKRSEQVLEAVAHILARGGRAIVSRSDVAVAEALRERFTTCTVEVFQASGVCVIRETGHAQPGGGGCVAVLSAGTSDIPVAEEAAVVAREMGCEVFQAFDVGVAGLHRLTQPLAEMKRRGVDAVVVAAGMDGALPSVVSGLVDVPVIGLPTSVGYGLGGRGIGALISMLQTCSPGLSVVNIDNGVGAGATAALIANRVAAARRATAPLANAVPPRR